jgi:hypothetical protein
MGDLLGLRSVLLDVRFGALMELVGKQLRRV